MRSARETGGVDDGPGRPGRGRRGCSAWMEAREGGSRDAECCTGSTMYRATLPITTHGQPATALAFDPVSDTLWAGDNAGTVAALHSVHAVRGVSFPVGGTLSVKQIAVADNHVRALGIAGNGLGAWAKGGMNKWYFRCVAPAPADPGSPAPARRRTPSPRCPPPRSRPTSSPSPPPRPTSSSSTRSPALSSARPPSPRSSPISSSPIPPCSPHPPMATSARTIPAPRYAERMATSPSSHMPVVSRISRHPVTFSSPSAGAQGLFPFLSLLSNSCHVDAATNIPIRS